MFKMIGCNNGRTVYYGKIMSITDTEMEVFGIDWDSSKKEEVKTTLTASFREDSATKAQKLAKGMMVVFMFLPGLKNPTKGDCEAIALQGECFLVEDEKNREVVVLNGTVSKGEWSKSKKAFFLTFQDVKDAETGDNIGAVFEYERYGLKFKNSLLRATCFLDKDEKKPSQYSAKKASEKLKKGVSSALVFGVQKGEYNKKPSTSYMCRRFAFPS